MHRIACMFVWNRKYHCEVLEDIGYIRVCVMHRLNGGKNSI